MAGNQEIREIVLKIIAETREGEAGLKRVEDQSKALREEITKAGLGFAAFGGAVAGVVAIINRGQGVSELTAAFNTLSKQAGSLAANEIQQLRAATQGLLSDTELMRASNEALAAGLKPEQFRAVAEAADTLGDAFGKNTKVALDDLTRALVTGQEKLLKQYTIQIDNAAAEKKFADSIGITTKHLNEAGKLEAARIAILEEVKKKTEQLAGGTDTAGDAVQRIGAAFSNSLDTMSRFINEASGVVAVFDAISNAAQRASTLIEAYYGKSNQALIFQKQERLNLIKSGDQNYMGGLGVDTALFGGDLEKKQKEIFELQNDIDGLIGKSQQERAESEKVRTEIEKRGQSTEELRKKYTDFGKTSEEANKKAEETTKKVTAAQDELKAAILSATDANRIQPLADALEKAFAESFSPGKAQAAFEPFIQEFRAATRKELETKYKDALADSSTRGVTLGLIQGLEDQAVAAKQYEFAKRLEEATKEAFNNTVGFFADLLTSSVTGSFQDIEETAKDALRRVAIGFASQMAASIASELGISGLGNIGSAQGLGQAIAASLGFEGGGVKTISELLGETGAAGALTGSAAALDLSAVALTSAATALSAAGTAGAFANVTAGGGITGAGFESVTGSIAGPGALSSALVNSGIIAAVVTATVATVASGVGSFNAGQKGGIAAGIKSGFDGIDDLGAAFASGGLSIPINLVSGIAGSFFGGDSQKAIERENREKLLDSIIEKLGGDTFSGVNGPIKLSDKKFNVDTSNPLSGQTVGLVNPLSQLLTGGDDKLGSDLAGIFTDAVSNAENFNEVIVNTQALMDGLGINAEDAKQGLLELFLDGKISAAEFGADLNNLNILAQDALVGPDSIKEALNIIAKNIDGEGEDSPRVALKGLELEFKALAQAGYDSTSEIVGYFQSIGSPEVAAVFEDLGALGVDSFDDIASAAAENPDLVFAIIDAIQGLNSELQNTDSSGIAGIGDDASTAAGNVERLTKRQRDLNGELDKTIRKRRELDAFGGGRGESSDDTGGGSELGRFRS